MWTDLPVGTYTVCFTGLAGKFTPTCRNVTIAAGTLVTTTGTFT